VTQLGESTNRLESGFGPTRLESNSRLAEFDSNNSPTRPTLEVGGGEGVGEEGGEGGGAESSGEAGYGEHGG
jgi:hypothetical protein